MSSIISAVALVAIALIPNSGGYVRANCFGSLSDQLTQARGVFDVTITDSVHKQQEDICQYTVAINAVLKSDHPFTLKKFHLKQPRKGRFCTRKEVEKNSCLSEGGRYLFFSRDGSDFSLKEEVKIHYRFNYLQPIEKKKEAEDFLKYNSSEGK